MLGRRGPGRGPQGAKSGWALSWGGVAPLAGLEPATCCLEEVSAPSGTFGRVRFQQFTSDTESGQSCGVRSGYGRWNDTENDTGREHASQKRRSVAE